MAPGGQPRTRLNKLSVLDSAVGIGSAAAATSLQAADVDHVKIWQTVGKLRRRHGLVMTGEPREPGYRVEEWLWEAPLVTAEHQPVSPRAPDFSKRQLRRRSLHDSARGRCQEVLRLRPAPGRPSLDEVRLS